MNLDYVGINNKDLEKAIGRLHKGQSYKDCSTVIICPTRGVIPAHVVGSWMGLMRPMNQKTLGPLFYSGYEVGDAYNQALHGLLQNPEIAGWKYVLTLEEDNTPPSDGLLKLIEAIEGQVDGNKYDAVGGLYWTKGAGGQPMCYGDPNTTPFNFIPQIPNHESLKRCNGLGMGFTLFRMSMLKEMWEKAEKDPKSGAKLLFWTKQQINSDGSASGYTQDLYFFEKAAKAGYLFACDSRVKVGHYSIQEDITW